MSATRFPNGVSVTNRGATVKTEVVSRTKVIPINFADGTTETDTSFTLPSTAILRGAYVYVRTAEATGTTKTIDVGTNTSGVSDDADGILDGVSVSATGLVGPTVTETTGTNEVYISASTYGALMADQELGTDVTGNTGYVNARPDTTSGGAVISWTPGSNDFAELVADIIIEYDEIVTDIRL